MLTQKGATVNNGVWIPVDQDLPAFDKEVLVTGEGRVELAKLNDIVSRRSGNSPEWTAGKNSYEDIWFTPTHWCAFPDVHDLNNK
jgi:hypothetical protein